MDIREKRKIIHEVFEAAHNYSGIDFLYLLVRVEGMKADWTDYFLEVWNQLKEKNDLSTSDLLTDDFLEFIASLLGLVAGEPYGWAPFYPLSQGLGRSPNLNDKLRFLIRKARESGSDAFADLLKDSYFPVITLSDKKSPTKIEAKRMHNSCKNFTRLFLDEYFQQLLKYRGQPRYIKVGFQIFELLVDDQTGLYGFYSHYPGGGKSWWIRTPKNVDCANLTGGLRVEPFVGLMPFEDEWKVDGKRLHELGFKGRYNTEGYWLPIIYPANPQPLLDEAKSFSDDPDIQGCFFYVLATGFHGIEFVVKTNIHLPYKTGSIGNQVHFHRCLDDEKEGSPSPHNFQVYDGWFPLDSLQPDDFKGAFEIIGRVINRLVLAYNGVAEWRIKYRFAEKIEPLLLPDADAMTAFNSLLLDFPKGKDADVLDFALDWYRRGRVVTNVFASFLYYYISIESVAQAVWDGDADFGLNFTKETKPQRKKKRRECIEEAFKKYYETDPEKFVRIAYFACLGTLKSTTETVAKLVFGEEHSYVARLFENSAEDGKSLSKLRSEIAHGLVSMLSRADERVVGKRLDEMARISKEFLIRLALSLTPEMPIPDNAVPFTSLRPLSDPRNSLVIRDVQGLVSLEDWRIKGEWVA